MFEDLRKRRVHAESDDDLEKQKTEEHQPEKQKAEKHQPEQRDSDKHELEKLEPEQREPGPSPSNGQGVIKKKRKISDEPDETDEPYVFFDPSGNTAHALRVDAHALRVDADSAPRAP